MSRDLLGTLRPLPRAGVRRRIVWQWKPTKDQRENWFCAAFMAWMPGGLIAWLAIDTDATNSGPQGFWSLERIVTMPIALAPWIAIAVALAYTGFLKLKAHPPIRVIEESPDLREVHKS
jgi:hypothetical protein